MIATKRIGRPAEDLIARCIQCGRLGADVLRLSKREVRCSCRRCGAVFRSRDLGAVQHMSALYARSTSEAAGPLPTPEDGPEAATLEAFMPSRMLLWLRRSGEFGGGAPSAEELGQETLERWYVRYDNFTRQARVSRNVRETYEATSDVPLARVPDPLPTFAHVLASLHSSCFDRETAARTLEAWAGGSDASSAVCERVLHIGRWLASPSGRPSRWIDDAEDPAVAPSRDEVATLLLPGALAGRIGPDEYRVLQGALFGTARGPSLRTLTMHFSAARLEDALRAYLSDGSRPLRAHVLAALRSLR